MVQVQKKYAGGDIILRIYKTAAGQMHKYARVVNMGIDRMIHLADIEFKLQGKKKFRVPIQSINKLDLVVPFEEQTLEVEAQAMEEDNGSDVRPPPGCQLLLEGDQEQLTRARIGGEQLAVERRGTPALSFLTLDGQPPDPPTAKGGRGWRCAVWW
jgi:hypothetical protein